LFYGKVHAGQVTKLQDTTIRYYKYMQIIDNAPLEDYSTMRLGGFATALTTVTSKEELLEAIDWAKHKKLPILVLGGGSNSLFHDGYRGLIIINRIPGFKVISPKDDHNVTIQVGAGESWDKTVEHTVKLGLHGIECMSAIPGRAGAMPVQNAGAYGQEAADFLTELEAYDLKTKKFVTLKKSDCGFGYRTSIFKSTYNRRYIITSITLELTKESAVPPFYDRLQKYLDEHEIKKFTPKVLRDAVIKLRSSLPDPTKIPNCGSFFKNPMVNPGLAVELTQKYPDMPQWPMPDGHVKLAAGWLLENAGLKGYRSHGMELYSKNALIIVNRSAKDYYDLAAFRQEIIDTVLEKFNVKLEQEPELF
jgi:UDP-N-acetylmuramate dehydrogenase